MSENVEEPPGKRQRRPTILDKKHGDAIKNGRRLSPSNINTDI